jgi:hypothetical protein
MGNRVVHFEIQADDVQRAQNFYKNVLGWNFDQVMSKDQGGMDYWTIKTGEQPEMGINGGLYERPAENPLHTYDCTVSVGNVDSVAEAAVKNGGKITREKSEIPGVGYFVGIQDTEGNRVGLLQPTDWQPK